MEAGFRGLPKKLRLTQSGPPKYDMQAKGGKGVLLFNGVIVRFGVKSR